ncbi:MULTISPECIES: hypothetical protein [Thermoanaerobacter]|uniref:hypothetical protein n=1 Tax=Thermoanaerobacter TaxID=1754 RepID=UPI0003729ADB
MRVSMHPGQYTVLNSTDKNVEKKLLKRSSPHFCLCKIHKQKYEKDSQASKMVK